MKAGRELDALIAEKVMKLLNVGRRNTGHGYATHLAYYAPPLKEYKRVPDYSTQITDAWLVVGKLDLPFTLQKNKQFKGGHYASFIVDKKFKAAQAATAPLAICLAALEAIA